MINVSVSDCYVLDLVPVHFESQNIWFGILLVIRFHVLYIYTYIYLPQRFTCSSIQMSRPVQGICFTFACSVCLKEGQNVTQKHELVWGEKIKYAFCCHIYSFHLSLHIFQMACLLKRTHLFAINYLIVLSFIQISTESDLILSNRLLYQLCCSN